MMRNLKDLAHRIASGEEVGNLNLAQSLELLVRVLVGNDAELGIRISTASFLSYLRASSPQSVSVCLVC